MIGLLRTILRIRPPAITPDKAIMLAKAEVERQGKPWREPVRIAHRLHEYVVWTNADRIGGNMNVLVDIHTGEIKAVRGPTPR